jgi:SAM-dependent methyltransferase
LAAGAGGAGAGVSSAAGGVAAGSPAAGRSLFDPLAAAYDAARPTYPDALYDELAGLAGRPLAGARVVDVGAGTGISARGLGARGAEVLALDHGMGMLQALRRRSPTLPAAQADAHLLPLRAGVADLVCYAQAWHWVRVPAAAAEVARVLRPGGALALWWNDEAALGEPWWELQKQLLEASGTGYRREYRAQDVVGDLASTGLFAPPTVAIAPWERTLDLDTYQTWLRSKSYVAALGPAQEEFLRAVRASLAEAFPDGLVREPFRTTLYVAHLAGARPGR